MERTERFVAPLLGALILGYVGWNSYDPSSGRHYEYQAQMVVRPTSASVTVEQGPDLTPVKGFPGLFDISEKSSRWTLSEPGWPDTSFDVAEPRGITTARSAPPRSTLSLTVDGNPKQKVTIRELPEKTELTVVQNQIRLQPGPHELLIQADGYLPKRLSVELTPNERKEMSLQLVALPGLPGANNTSIRPSFPTVSLPQYQLPSTSVPAYRPPAPIHRPPPTRYPHAPVAPPVTRPVPRFTPVPPARQPQPRSTDPVPRFTPIGG